MLVCKKTINLCLNSSNIYIVNNRTVCCKQVVHTTTFRKNHNFNTNVKLILTEQINHIDIDIEKDKEKLKQMEDF